MSVVVKNLTKIYETQKAVNNISFEAHKGEILGFLGPNGAGKTTTMKIISCFTSATEGDVSVCGFDVLNDPIEVKKRVGYLAEHNPLYDTMYIREYLEFVANIHKIKNVKERIDEMIELTGLQKEQHKLIQSLSKGYRQRVGLAQALIHNPEVLILDEPTSGLDPNQLVGIRQLIKDLGKDKTVIFSSHIMQEIQHLCDRVLILNSGELVANDDISSLKNRVKGRNILEVEFLEDVDEEILNQIEGLTELVLISDNQYKFVSSRDLDIRVAVFDCAVNNKWHIIGMNLEEISIENVFQTLTI